MFEIEEKIAKIIGKKIKEIDILFDEDSMDMFFMKFEDGGEFCLHNKKRNTGDDYRIYPEFDLELFIGAEIISFEMIENLNHSNFESIIIEALSIKTNKGEIILNFENEGYGDAGWGLIYFVVLMNI